MNRTSLIVLVWMSVAAVVWAGLRAESSPANALVKPADLVCYDIHSPSLDKEGWHRSTIDERGSAYRWREVRSLECYDVLNPSRSWSVTERWYRRKT